MSRRYNVRPGQIVMTADAERAQNNALIAVAAAQRAEASADEADLSEAEAKQSEIAAKASEQAAAASAAAAAASEAGVQADADAAALSAANALASENAAKASEIAAAGSEANAATSATESADSATASAGSAVEAKAAEDATEAIYDDFDDRYLGPFTTPPTVDNDGDPLLVGALYFHDQMPGSSMRVWNGVTWQPLPTSGSTLASDIVVIPAGSIESEDVQAALEEIDGDVTALASRVTATEGKNTEQDGRLDGIDTSITGLLNADVALDGRMDQAEIDIDALETAVANVYTETEANAKFVELAGDIMTGNLTISKVNPTILLDKAAAGQSNVIYGRTGASYRWGLVLGNSGAESGADAGSDFALYRYSDAGAQVDTPIVSNRASGDVTILHKLGVGAAASTGQSFRVSKAITGATTSYGAIVNAAVQADVTNGAIYYRTSGNTIAAAFTLTALHHFSAAQSTFGAGSAVTNQYGFMADSTLIGATNNYGFYGNIPAATGRWNFYGGGTARNYMAGALSIGATTDPGAGGLFVNGSAVSNGTFTANGGTFYADAIAANNAAYYLRDEADVTQGIFYWNRADDTIRVRRYATGAVLDGEIAMLDGTANGLKWVNQTVWNNGNFPMDIVTTPPGANSGLVWNGTKYVPGNAGGALIDDVAPASPTHGMLWWESDTGGLFIRYNDGDSQQWVQVNAAAGDFVKKSGDRMTGALVVNASDLPSTPWPNSIFSQTISTHANYAFNGYIREDGTAWRANLNGYVGQYSFNNSDGTFSWLASTAVVAPGADATMASKMTLGRDGSLVIPSGYVSSTCAAGSLSGTYGLVGYGTNLGGGVAGFGANRSVYGTLGKDSYSFYGAGNFYNSGTGQYTSGLTIGGALGFSHISNFAIGFNNAANFTTGTGQFEMMYSGTAKFIFTATYMAPSSDGSMYCGLSSQRFYQFFATTGTIQTSDEREKQDIRSLDERERAAALRIKGLISAYRWKPESAGGRDARIYIGVIAQRLEEALVAEGLDPTQYSMLNKDMLTRHIDPVMGEDGELLEEARDEPTGEYRYSVDYAQISMFVLAAL